MRHEPLKAHNASVPTYSTGWCGEPIKKGAWMQEGPWLSGRCGEVRDLKRQRKRSGRGAGSGQGDSAQPRCDKGLGWGQAVVPLETRIWAWKTGSFERVRSVGGASAARTVRSGAVQQHISNICGDGNSYNRTIQHGSRVGGYRAIGRWLVSLRIGSFNFSSFSSI